MTKAVKNQKLSDVKQAQSKTPVLVARAARINTGQVMTAERAKKEGLDPHIFGKAKEAAKKAE